MEYNFGEIEKWAKQFWREKEIYTVQNNSDKPKCYVLDMFPYPSGAGLHVGHPLGYIASDIYARYKRLIGFNVLHPMGFDSFGLPAEQYALETGQHPADTTQINIARYREQLDNIGFSFDWKREVRTSEPDYYKHTQSIFLRLYNSWYCNANNRAESIETLLAVLETNGNASLIKKHSKEVIFSAAEWSAFSTVEKEHYLMQHRLAYRSKTMVNWCEALSTVLANDEVVGGVSERGGHPVERKLMNQWSLRITKYADRLIDGLQDLDFPESLKIMQRNWIGKSEGASLNFELEILKDALSIEKNIVEVFTTRPDTIYGVSFLVLAPELALVDLLKTKEQATAVDAYVKHVKGRSEIERMSDKKISGVFTGAYALHPLTQEKLPIWISEYVLAGYGTGAIMAVPCGDERDYKFAKHFNIAIPNIFEGVDISENACTDYNVTIANSEMLNGLKVTAAKEKMLALIEEKNIGYKKVNYKFRDAGFSRQRYWGEPFPVSYDAQGNVVTDINLPVVLPHLSEIKAGPDGKGPLANDVAWVNQNGMTRETDTMPGYAGSSWYYLRYMDPQNADAFCSRAASDYWNQVDVYVGGAEHAVGHLLYSRMWCKVLYDLGEIGHDEPYKKIINQGMIQGNSRLVYRVKGTNHFVSAGLKDQHETDTLYADYGFCDGLELDITAFKNWREEYATATFELEDGKYICGSLVEKMSKRLYNVVNPDDIIAQYGADTFRMYEMFLGPIEMSKPWDTKGIEGVHRFIKKLWRLFYNEQGICITNDAATDAENKILHKHIKKIESDIENFAFNTSISAFMICTNDLASINCSKKSILQELVITLAPFAPHIAEHLWQKSLGNTSSVLDASFPIFNASYLVENSFIYPIAINGKARAEMEFALDAVQTDVEPLVLQNEIVQKWMEGKAVKKFIFVKGKMINVVV
jgi:leucyl-tRNA synthetase